MSLTLRKIKQIPLTHDEMDDNLIFLEDNLIKSVSGSGNSTLTLTKKDDNIIIVDLSHSHGNLNNAWIVKTIDFTCEVNKKYIVNTSINIIEATLPDTASNGDFIKFCDGNDFSVNALKVLRNGNLIETIDEDMTVDIKNISFGLVFYNNNWLLS